MFNKSAFEAIFNFAQRFYVILTMLSPRLSNIYNCSVNKIDNLLKDLNAYKYPGPDGLSPGILECESVLSPSICAFQSISPSCLANCLASGNALT